MDKAWLDMTIRPQVEVEVDLQADNSIELSWPFPGASRLTILLQPDEADHLHKHLGRKLLLVER